MLRLFRRRRARQQLLLMEELLGDTVIATLIEVMKNQRAIMADLSVLQASVDANTQAVADVAAEVSALKTATVGPSADQGAIDIIASQITANNAALAALKVVPAA